MFLGADPTGAHLAAQQMLRISGAMHDLTTRLLTVETTVHYASGAVGLIDETTQSLRATAAAVETAGHEIGTFRLPLELQWHPLAQLSERLSPEQARETEADLFGQVMAAIVARETPAAAGLASEYFPPGYIEWLAADRAVAEAAHELAEYRRIMDGTVGFDQATHYRLADTLQRRLDERSGLVFHEAVTVDLPREAHDPVEVTAAAIGAAIAPSFRNGSALLGSFLASAPPGVQEARFFELLAVDIEFARAFFAQLGAAGTVALVHAWADADSTAFDSVIAQISTGLGRVTLHGGLGFSGEEFVHADRLLEPLSRGDDRGFHVEQLLLDGAFAPDFVVSAATGSFDRYLSDAGSPHNLMPWYDRRITTMAALLRHDAVPTFLDLLSEAEMSSLVGSQRFDRSAAVGGSVFAPYGEAHPRLDDDDLIPTLFAAAALSSIPVGDRVIDVLGQMDGAIQDKRLADGLSLLLAGRAPEHFNSDREGNFLDAYDTVARSGSGLSVVLTAMGPAMAQFVEHELVDGELDDDGAEAVEFGSFIARIRQSYYQSRLDHADGVLEYWAEANRWEAIASGAVAGLSVVGAIGGVATLAGPVAIGGVMLSATTFAAIGVVALAAGLVLLAFSAAHDDERDPRVPTLADLVVASRFDDDVLAAAALAGRVPHPLTAPADRERFDDWSRTFADTVNDQFDLRAVELVEPLRSASDGG